MTQDIERGLSARNFGFVRRMVIKVGTSLLRKSDNAVDRSFLRNIAGQIAELRGAKPRREIVLVSSGAVGFGMMQIGLTRRPTDIATLQAVAAVGQPLLMQAWAESFEPHGVRVSQLLLTNDGLQDRSRYLNAKHALTRLLDLNVVPIVNENDTVAVEELTFGDNDKLSALVAAMIDGDLLVILTDVDGFYEPDEPRTGRKPLRMVRDIRPEWIAATESRYRTGRRGFTLGGMSAKLKAALIALRSGASVIIANGRAKNILAEILEGRPVGTLFLPKDRGLKGKKVWLSFFPSPAGQIVVDRGAAAAIARNGRSLLASGILLAVGKFPRGSCVSVVSEDGREIARGLTYYSSEEITVIAGSASSSIRDKLRLPVEDPVPPEVIHRDELAILS